MSYFATGKDKGAAAGRRKNMHNAAGRLCTTLSAERNTVVAAADLRVCKKFMASFTSGVSPRARRNKRTKRGDRGRLGREKEGKSMDLWHRPHLSSNGTLG